MDSVITSDSILAGVNVLCFQKTFFVSRYGYELSKSAHVIGMLIVESLHKTLYFFVMKKESRSSFTESKGLRILSEMLESTKRIKTHLNDKDRIPLFDGHINLLNEKEEIIKECTVQVKSESGIKLSTRGANKGKYPYHFDKDVLEAVRKDVTNNIVVYFVVDASNGKIFYKILTRDFLVSLNYINNKDDKVKYSFEENDVLSNPDKLYSQLLKIHSETDSECFKTKEEIIAIQKAMNTFYEKLEQIVFIKKKLWPTLWKFGIKTSKNQHFNLIHEKTGVNLGGDCSVFAIFPIQYGYIKPEIMEYKAGKEDLFTNLDFIGNSDPQKYLDSCLSRFIDFYFDNTCCLEIMPENCLYEIIYSFLYDIENFEKTIKRKGDVNYSASETIDLENLLKIVNPYFAVLNRILGNDCIFDIKTDEDRYYISATIGNTIKFKEDKINKTLLAYFAIEECKKRKIATIKKRHRNFVNRFGDFDGNILSQEVNLLLSTINNEINKSLDMIPTKFQNPLRGEYIYKLTIESYPFSFCSLEMALKDSSKPITFVEDEINKEEIYEWRCAGLLIDTLFRGGMPLFNLTRIIVKEALCKKLSLETNPIKADSDLIRYPF